MAVGKIWLSFARRPLSGGRQSPHGSLDLSSGAPAGPLQKPEAALLPCRALLQQNCGEKPVFYTRPSTKVDGRCFFVGGRAARPPTTKAAGSRASGATAVFWPDAAALVLPPRAGSGGLLVCTHLFQAGARDGLSTDAGGHGPQDGLKTAFLTARQSCKGGGPGKNTAAGRTKRQPVLGRTAGALWIVFVLSFGRCTVQEGFLRCFISWCR